MIEESFNHESETIRNTVASHFTIYEMKTEPDSILLYCHIYPDSLEDSFDRLRKELWKNNYVPFLEVVGGEHIIRVVRTPPQQYKSVKVNIIMLVATILSTSFAGAILWKEYMDHNVLFSFTVFFNGILFFTVPLMSILGVHEMGHYLTAKKHGVESSLPFFIPIPPLGVVPLGTMGAFINMREPIPNKKALLEIGAAGPLAGFIVALPVAALGLWLTATNARPLPPNLGDMGVITLSMPPVYYAMEYFIPVSEGIRVHPMAFAGWVGFFVTFLNLLPMGQLDGGHVFRALLGKKSHIASYSVMGIMVILSFLYSGWLIIVFLVLFFGLKHPPPLNEITPLDSKQVLVGGLVVLLFAACIIPIPISSIRPVSTLETTMSGEGVEFIEMASTNTSLSAVEVDIENTGNTFLRVRFTSVTSLSLIGEGWFLDAGTGENLSKLHRDEVPSINLNSTESASLGIMVTPPDTAQPGNYTLVILMRGYRTVRGSEQLAAEGKITIRFTILDETAHDAALEEIA